MSFLEREIIQKGYIAKPKKRLNSVSDINIEPVAKRVKIQPKRALVNPFEQHYVTPFLRMFDEEEEENKEKLQKQKSILKTLAESIKNSALAQKIVKTARNAYEHPATQKVIELTQRMYEHPIDTLQEVNDALANTTVGKAVEAGINETGRRIDYGFTRTIEHPLDTVYDFITLPADAIHAVIRNVSDEKTYEPKSLLQYGVDAASTGVKNIVTPVNDALEELRIRAVNSREREQEMIEMEERRRDMAQKEIEKTLRAINTYTQRVGGLPRWTVRRLRNLKKKWVDDVDNMVDVSSEIQSWNEDEARRHQEAVEATQNLQGLWTSTYQQKGYKERMDATKTLQALLKSQQVQKDLEKQQEATKQIQGLLQGRKSLNDFQKQVATTQTLQSLLRNKQTARSFNERREATQELQGLLRATPQIQQDFKKHQKAAEEIQGLLRERKAKHDFPSGNSYIENLQGLFRTKQTTPFSSYQDATKQAQAVFRGKELPDDLKFMQQASDIEDTHQKVSEKQAIEDLKRIKTFVSKPEFESGIIVPPLLKGSLKRLLQFKKQHGISKRYVSYSDPTNFWNDGQVYYNPLEGRLYVDSTRASLPEETYRQYL